MKYAVGYKVLLLMKNLRLHSTRKLSKRKPGHQEWFCDHFVGPFVLLECLGKTVYWLDLSSCTALRGVHSVFHVSLLHDWLSNRLHADMPTIKIDGEAEYKAASIKGHREHNSELQYLTLFVGFDSSEDT